MTEMFINNFVGKSMYLNSAIISNNVTSPKYNFMATFMNNVFQLNAFKRSFSKIHFSISKDQFRYLDELA